MFANLVQFLSLPAVYIYIFPLVCLHTNDCEHFDQTLFRSQRYVVMRTSLADCPFFRIALYLSLYTHNLFSTIFNAFYNNKQQQQ